MEKQITPELNFYKIDKQFLSYLYDQDKKENGFSCVPTMNYLAEQKEKFMCGIIISVNGIKYLAPVSSYAIKKSNNVLLYSDDGRVTSSIRLNFMFPVAKGSYKRYDFEKETDPKYLSVVKQEWLSANQQRDHIRKLAKSTYLEVRRVTAKGNAPKWACNFLYLEKLCREWEQSKAEQGEQVGQVGRAEKNNTKEELTDKDREVIDRIRKSKSGKEYSDLEAGKYSGNKESADMKMMRILAFFTDCDIDQMDRIYKSTNLYEPAKGNAYVEKLKTTVVKADREPKPNQKNVKRISSKSTGRSK